jgi:hypothetical protein
MASRKFLSSNSITANTHRSATQSIALNASRTLGRSANHTNAELLAIGVHAMQLADIGMLVHLEIADFILVRGEVGEVGRQLDRNQQATRYGSTHNGIVARANLLNELHLVGSNQCNRGLGRHGSRECWRSR